MTHIYKSTSQSSDTPIVLSGKRVQPAECQSAGASGAKSGLDKDLNTLLSEAVFERTYANSRAALEGKGFGRWEKDEHKKFLQGLRMYGNDWKKIEAIVKTRTCSQVRSHAQKYFASQKEAKHRKGGDNEITRIEIHETANMKVKLTEDNIKTDGRSRRHTNSDVELTTADTSINKLPSLSESLVIASTHINSYLSGLTIQLRKLAERLSHLRKLVLGSDALGEEINQLEKEYEKISRSLVQISSMQLTPLQTLCISRLKNQIVSCLSIISQTKEQEQDFTAAHGSWYFGYPLRIIEASLLSAIPAQPSPEKSYNTCFELINGRNLSQLESLRELNRRKVKLA